MDPCRKSSITILHLTAGAHTWEGFQLYGTITTFIEAGFILLMSWAGQYIVGTPPHCFDLKGLRPAIIHPSPGSCLQLHSHFSFGENITSGTFRKWRGLGWLVWQDQNAKQPREEIQDYCFLFFYYLILLDWLDHENGKNIRLLNWITSSFNLAAGSTWNVPEAVAVSIFQPWHDKSFKLWRPGVTFFQESGHKAKTSG